MLLVVLWTAMFLLFTLPTARAAEMKVLRGHVPNVVSQLTPKGRFASTNELWLAIGLPMRDEAGLEAFVNEVSDPASPNYRQFLTREALTARFGPTEQDYEAVKAFARSNGLTIQLMHSNRLLLDVSGPVANIEKALHVTMRTYKHPHEARDFFAPDVEPTVDASLPVADIGGLSDFARPHPKKVRHNSAVARVVAHNGTAPDASGCYFGDDFRNAYVPGTTLTGAGQSVGLVEFDGFFTNDIYNYALQAGGGRTNIAIERVLVDNFDGTPTTGPDGGNGEVALDIELAMAMAPGLSKIVSFEAGINGNQNDVLNKMLAHSNILNLACCWSWGGPSQTTDAIFKSMAAVGQSFFDASGDSLAYTTGANSTNGVDNPNLVNGPASNPWMTQVGGTTLTMNGSGASYAGEVVWNWTAEGVGSSGGISSYYSIPTWQKSVPNMASRGGSTSFRNIPDVAACADNVYEIYENGTNAYPGDPPYSLYDGTGGTSCSAPLWAGFMALVNEQMAGNNGKGGGCINAALYAIATNNYAACFNDITSGNNIWTSSPNLFYAAQGYDLCTGLGSMNGTNLINALVGQVLGPSVNAPFFTDEKALGNNWFYLDPTTNTNNPFGYYSALYFPYIYHLDLGWEYYMDGGNGAAYFYDFADGTFFYTEPGLFPYLYDFNQSAWMYYSPASGEGVGRYTSNPRWFLNLTTQTWVNHL